MGPMMLVAAWVLIAPGTYTRPVVAIYFHDEAACEEAKKKIGYSTAWCAPTSTPPVQTGVPKDQTRAPQ